MLNRLMIFVFLFTSCSTAPTSEDNYFSTNDSTALVNLIRAREKAMIDRDIKTVAQQFDTNAIFINGGGFYYEGLHEIENFHNSMFSNDSLTYTYKIGNVTIKPVRPNVAVVYYPWQQQWTLSKVKSDTLNEVGLMTLIATKNNGQWKWKSVTNQRTKEFFEDLPTHTQKAIK